MNDPALQRALVIWYQANKRNLPWRQTCDPYPIWVSEIMLQQTQAETVIPYYYRFIAAFPDLSALAHADLSSALKVWEGLGYYSRERNLLKAAQFILEEYQAQMPSDQRLLKKIPGVGAYTAAAISSIAFNQPVAVVDGNVRRVMSRWMVHREATHTSQSQRLLAAYADRFLLRSDPGTWNQAVMELGAVLCLPRNPQCHKCPVQEYCGAYAQNLTDQIPRPKPGKPLPHYQVTAGIIHRGEFLLITRRRKEGLLGGLWEFPGGKQEPGETLQECLHRELAEELAIKVEVHREYCSVDHAYSHFRITLHAFECRYLTGQPQALGCAEWRWVKPEELTEFAFPKADRVIIQRLKLQTESAKPAP